MDRAHFAPLGLLIAVLTACGGDEADRALDDGESPITQYGLNSLADFANGFGGRETRELTADEKRELRGVEDAVAVCMADRGFEYHPEPVDDQPAAAADDAYALPPEEFARQYGYGITTLNLDETAADLSSVNQDIRAGLSPRAQEEYDLALHGDDSRDGCRELATQEVGKTDSAFDALYDDYYALVQRIADDPRLGAANAAWSDCMSDRGYPGIDHVMSASLSITDQLMALHGVDPDAPPTSDDGTWTFEKDLDVIDPVALDNLRREEIAMAQADFDCREEHYAPVWREVAIELETEFVHDHKSDLEQLRDR